MKRIFTSFLLFALCFVSTWAQQDTKGLQLNGVDQYMSIPNDAAFFPTKGGEYTVTARVRLSEFLSGVNARFVGNRAYTGTTTDKTTTGYELFGGESIEHFISVNSSLTGSPWSHSNNWAKAYGALDRYVHVAWVLIGGSQKSQIWVDGMMMDEKIDQMPVNFSNGEWGNHGFDILVGAGYKAAKNDAGKIDGAAFVSYFTKGEIDDVHFYNTALNEMDLIQDMTEFNAATANHLVAAYDFENIQGNKVPDVSGKGHDGELHGFEVAPVDCLIKVTPPTSQGRLSVLNAAGQIIWGGDVVPSGTEVTLVATPANGFELDYFTANGEAIEGDKYVVNGDVEFSAVFKEKQEATYLVRLGDVPEQGYITMKYADTGKTLYGGTQVEKGTKVQLIANPFDAEAYTLDYFTANDEKFEGDVYEVTADVVFNVVFKLKTVEPAEPVYAVPTGDDNIRRQNGSDRFNERLLYTVTVDGATLNGEAAPFTSEINKVGGSQREVFVDKTAETVELTAGDKVQLTFTDDIIWMHSYLYIDYDHDGTFNEDNELVAFSHFSAADNENGVNSLGEPTKHDCGIDIPAFVVADVAQDVKTRMRLKIDWNSKNPVGNVKQSIGGNAGTIVDFTANVHAKTAAPVVKFAVTFDQPAEGGSFKIMNGDAEITSGTEVEAGTELTVVAEPAQGYKLKTISVNGSVLDAGVTTFRVAEASNVAVVFMKNEPNPNECVISYEVVGKGSLMIINGNGDLINSGDFVPKGSADYIVMLQPEPGEELVSFKVNNAENKQNCAQHPLDPSALIFMMQPISRNMTLVAEFTGADEPVEQMHTITYSATPATSGSITVKVMGQGEIESGAQVKHGTEGVGATIKVNEGNELSSVLVNGVEKKGECIDIWGDGTYALTLPAVTEDVDIKVTFAKREKKITVNYTVSEGGSLNILVNDEDVKLQSGDQIVANSAIILEMVPDFGNSLTKLVVNGIDKTKVCDYDFIFDSYTLKLGHVNEDLNIEVSFLDETGIDQVVLDGASLNGNTLNVPAGAQVVLYNAAGQQVLSAQETVSVAHLAAGAYVARVAKDGAVKVIKFIKK